MAIEGPLRELGIHDVFQLLDLSRKTGTLRVTSELRDDEGVVLFDAGKVVHASVRSHPTDLERILRQAGRLSERELASARAMGTPGEALGELLVRSGAITPRELERQLRQAIESVVFELMSWQEGFFSFEERPIGDVRLDARIRISTESLLMEGARRIDEWSRIVDKVPSLSVIPVLAPVEAERASVLDLLPHEWEVLMMIDGERDLRGIAGALGRSEFEVAKIAYGLVSTGVVALQTPERPSVMTLAAVQGAEPAVARAREALVGGKFEEALSAARAALTSDPSSTEARLIAARSYTRMGRFSDALDELRRAVQADPLTAEVHLDLGYASVRTGEFAGARTAWEHYLRLAPHAPQAAGVRAAIETLSRLAHLLEAHADG